MFVIALLTGIFFVAVGVCLCLWIELRKEALSAQERSAVPVPDIQALGSARDVEREREALQDEIRRLKEDLVALEMKGQAQERSGSGAVLELRRENDELRRKTGGFSLSRDEEHLSHLRAENAAFRVQVEEAGGDLRQRALELSLAQAEMARLKEELALSGDAQKLVSQAKVEYQQKLDALDVEIKQLRLDNARLDAFSAAGAELDTLRQTLDDTSAKIRELEMTNAIQAHKNEHLQYELTKSRAQVAGLERVCENAVSLHAAQPRAGGGSKGSAGV